MYLIIVTRADNYEVCLVIISDNCDLNSLLSKIVKATSNQVVEGSLTKKSAHFKSNLRCRRSLSSIYLLLNCGTICFVCLRNSLFISPLLILFFSQFSFF